MSAFLDIFRHLRIKICIASESGPVSVFRWNGEREESFLMVNELTQALSNGPKEIACLPFPVGPKREED